MNKEQKIEAWDLLERLTSDELSSVEIIYPNPEFDGPSHQIICNGQWCGGPEETTAYLRFYGSSYLSCLRKARLQHGRRTGTELEGIEP